MKTKVRIQLGDPSGDGHGMHEDEHLLINGTIADVHLALEKLKKLGIDFHNICSDYEDNKVTDEVVEALRAINFDVSYFEKEENYVDGTDHYTDIMVYCLNYVSPELEVEKVEQERLPSIGRFGYGLFSH